MRQDRDRRARRPLAALVLSLALMQTPSVRAQDAETPAPPPAPAPSSGRPIDFRLPTTDDGRTPGVQGPADNGLPPVAPGESGSPAPTPAPTAPRIVPTQPRGNARPPATPTPAPTRSAPTPTPTPTPAPAAARPAPASPTPAPAPAPATPTPATGQPVADQPAPASPAAAPPASEPIILGAAPAEEVPAPPAGQGGTPLWAWLLAGFAALGAGAWYWRRRPASAGDAPVDLSDRPSPPPAAPPRSRAVPPVSAPPASTPKAPSSPTPASGPESAPSSFLPLSPASATPVFTPTPLVTRPAAERRAQVSMTLEIRSIRMTPEAVAVAFTLNLLNQGMLPATGMMVRIALGQGSAMPETVLARFFDGAGGSVLRDDMVLDAGAGEQLTTEAMLPRAIIEPLTIAGRAMLVPVLALDITYHWDGPGEAFGQNAGSFVLGREQGGGGSEKLAPLPLDRPSHAVDRPASRSTAMRRVQ